MKTRKLRLLSALLAVAMIFVMTPVGAFGVEFALDYKYDEENGTATVTGYVGSLPADGKVEIPATVTYQSRTYSVVAIGAYAFAAFSYSSRLSNIDLSHATNLKSIDQYAFALCTNLKSVDFSNISALESIGAGAFADCSNLESVNFTNATHLTSIGPSAFANCSFLESVDLSDAIRLETICANAFVNCRFLKTVILPINGVLKRIGNSAFSYQVGLAPIITEIVIPPSVEEIDDMAFVGCSELESITFMPGSKLQSVGSDAFRSCGKIYCEPTLKDLFYCCGNSNIITSVTATFIDRDVETSGPVDYGSPVTMPIPPSRDGYVFDGWYALDINGTCATTPFDFSQPLTVDTTFLAKWNVNQIVPGGKSSYFVTVEDGTACVLDSTEEEVITPSESIQVEEGQTVTIKAHEKIAGDMLFDHWEVREGNVQLVNERSATTTFKMPTTAVRIAAIPVINEGGGDDGAIVAVGIAVGAAGIVTLVYNAWVEQYSCQILGKGVSVPKTREEVALKAWELAGKPAVELNGEPLSEAAQAEKWATESGLMQNVDGGFNGQKKMSKLKALRMLDAAKKLGRPDERARSIKIKPYSQYSYKRQGPGA